MPVFLLLAVSNLITISKWLSWSSPLSSLGHRSTLPFTAVSFRLLPLSLRLSSYDLLCLTWLAFLALTLGPGRYPGQQRSPIHLLIPSSKQTFNFPGGSDGKASAYNAGDRGSIPGSGRSRGKEMATHSSTLAWRIPWTEEPGRLQPIRSQRSRVGHDWATSLHFCFTRGGAWTGCDVWLPAPDPLLRRQMTGAGGTSNPTGRMSF